MQADPKMEQRVLYIVYWGALEPLGRSLVLPAVCELAGLGATLTLVTFEKPADLADQSETRTLRTLMWSKGIKWVPLGYHKQPKLPATAFDVFSGLARAVILGLRSRPDIVHARTFVGGLIGAAVAFVLRAKFVYHNEGFYPDEQVDAGVWKAGSAPHRLSLSLERRMYAGADGVIALSERAKAAIERIPAVKQKATPVIAVPSCVDLDHFSPASPRRAWTGKSIRFIYIGSVGGRYLLDKIGRFTAIASQMMESVSLRVLTRAEPDLVARMVDSGGLPRESWSLDCVSRNEMPGELAHRDVGLFFLSTGLSEHGCSPTKIGEYWAMGLPVISTPNVSDSDEIIRRERVGVIVNDHSDESYRKAVSELISLLRDPETSGRCRRAAERHYSLKPACRRQALLYNRLCLPAPTADAYSPEVAAGLVDLHTQAPGESK